MGPILIVDDESEIRRAFTRYLSKMGYACIEAENGEEGLNALANHEDCEIVLTDISMPVMDGLEMIAECRARTARSIEFIILSGKGDKEKAIRALKLGVAEFLEKPMSWNAVMQALHQAEEQIARRRRYSTAVTAASTIRNELNEVQAKLSRSNRRVARQIANVARYRDNETAEHNERVGKYSRRLAEMAGKPADFCENLELAAMLHDIGKVSVPDAILGKEGFLTDEEYAIMKHHTVFGAQMLAEHRDNAILEMAYDITLSHHERWDGTGYPDRLVGEEIPLVARICGIVDVYDALRTARPYKPAYDHDQSMRIILEGDGRTEPDHFDPQLLSILRDNDLELRKIHDVLPDRSTPAY